MDSSSENKMSSAECALQQSPLTPPLSSIGAKHACGLRKQTGTVCLAGSEQTMDLENHQGSLLGGEIQLSTNSIMSNFVPYLPFIDLFAFAILNERQHTPSGGHE